MAKGKKPKYEDLSDKERGELEQAGMKADNDVNISALESGKKEFKRRQKSQGKELSPRKQRKAEEKETFKQIKSGEMDKSFEKQPKKEAVKAVTDITDPNAPETIYHSTIGSPGVYNPDAPDPETLASYDTTPNIISTLVEGESPSETISKGIESQAWKDIVDNKNRAFDTYDEDTENASHVDNVVQENISNVNAAKAVADIVADPNSVSEEDKDAINTMTSDQVSEITDQAVSNYIDGDPELEADAKVFRDNLAKSRINAAEPAIEKMGLQQYYPDAGTPLQVGSYSGSLIGNVSLFGHGSGRVPVGIIDARKRAMEKAANQRAKNKNAIIEMAFAKGAIPLQSRIDDESWEIINKYSELTGNNMGALDYNTKLGRKFFKELRELKTFATRTKSTEKIVNQLSKDVLDEKKHVPEYVQKLMQQFNGGLLNIEDLRKNPALMGKLEKELRAYQNASFQLQKHENLKLDKAPLNMKSGVDWNSKETAGNVEEVSRIVRGGNYDKIYSVASTFMDLSRVKKIVDSDIKQFGFYLGEGKEGEEQKYREQYYDYFIGLHPEQFEEELKTVTHNQAKFKRAQDFKEKKYKDSQTTVLTNIVDKDAAGVETKNNLKMDSELTANGVTSSGDVRNSYNKHTGYTPIVDKDNPNKLGGYVPLTDKQKKSKHQVSINNASFRIEGQTYNYGQAMDIALEKKRHYNKPDFDTKFPELAGLINMPVDGMVTVQPSYAEHGYGMDTEDGRVELGTNNYGSNSDKAYNMYTKHYSSSYETEEDILVDDGKSTVSIWTVGGEDFPTKAQADAYKAELDSEAITSGSGERVPEPMQTNAQEKENL